MNRMQKGAGLGVVLACSFVVGFASGIVTPSFAADAKQDIQDAGQNIKDAGHNVASGTRKTTHKAHKGVNRGAHKAAQGVDKGAQKVQSKTE